MIDIAIGLYQQWLTDDGLTKLSAWARDGLTDDQIAHNIGVHLSTLARWKAEHKEIRDALKKGKEVVDILVENALFKRAVGYDYEETLTEIRTDADGNVLEKHIRKSKKHVPPDTTAQIYWLKNRKPDRWRDRPQADGTSGDDPVLVLLKRIDEESKNATKP